MNPTPDKMAVQVDERLELLPGRAQRTLGNSALGHIGAVQDLKEFIQFPLECAFDQVQQEQEHDRKGQGPVTSEICFGASMPIEQPDFWKFGFGCLSHFGRAC